MRVEKRASIQRSARRGSDAHRCAPRSCGGNAGGAPNPAQWWVCVSLRLTDDEHSDRAAEPETTTTTNDVARVGVHARNRGVAHPLSDSAELSVRTPMLKIEKLASPAWPVVSRSAGINSAIA